MPNPLRLALTLQLDRERHLRFDWNALAILEEKLGENALDEDFFQKPMTATRLRAFAYAGLVHEDPGLTLERVGELISEHAGNLPAILQQAMREALPDAPAGEVGDRPTQADPRATD